MGGSKKTMKRRVNRMKNRVRSKYARRHSNRRKSMKMRGGYSQYMNNNGSQSNTYSLGSKLDANDSALANPPPVVRVAGQPDNLNHNALNAYGNSGAGSGFASKGWF